MKEVELQFITPLICAFPGLWPAFESFRSSSDQTVPQIGRFSLLRIQTRRHKQNFLNILHNDDVGEFLLFGFVAFSFLICAEKTDAVGQREHRHGSGRNVETFCEFFVYDCKSWGLSDPVVFPIN